VQQDGVVVNGHDFVCATVLALLGTRVASSDGDAGDVRVVGEEPTPVGLPDRVDVLSIRRGGGDVWKSVGGEVRFVDSEGALIAVWCRRCRVGSEDVCGV